MDLQTFTSAPHANSSHVSSPIRLAAATAPSHSASHSIVQAVHCLRASSVTRAADSDDCSTARVPRRAKSLHQALCCAKPFPLSTGVGAQFRLSSASAGAAAPQGYRSAPDVPPTSDPASPSNEITTGRAAAARASDAGAAQSAAHEGSGEAAAAGAAGAAAPTAGAGADNQREQPHQGQQHEQQAKKVPAYIRKAKQPRPSPPQQQQQQQQQQQVMPARPRDSLGGWGEPWDTAGMPPALDDWRESAPAGRWVGEGPPAQHACSGRGRAESSPPGAKGGK